MAGTRLTWSSVHFVRQDTNSESCEVSPRSRIRSWQSMAHLWKRFCSKVAPDRHAMYNAIKNTEYNLAQQTKHTIHQVEWSKSNWFHSTQRRTPRIEDELFELTVITGLYCAYLKCFQFTTDFFLETLQDTAAFFNAGLHAVTGNACVFSTASAAFVHVRLQVRKYPEIGNIKLHMQGSFEAPLQERKLDCSNGFAEI